ncbi:hypothetical protein TrispH2_008838 [Trichoplax sp. H2]|nr:hypothetical protein TrispH2_008838 [Trichoplax sp. H2]|eukprot:RDD39115.1 hypothetical protein TrispH2_008838 [Trichoplax sp. H2]
MRFKALVICILCTAWMVHGQECPYFGNARKPETHAGLSHCTWFSKTCCRRTEVTSVFNNMPRLTSASAPCQQRMEYLRCYFCSPNQGNWYNRSAGRFIICSSFCNTIFNHCRTAIYNGTLFSSLYHNGTEFCTALKFRTSTLGCYSFDSSVFGGTRNIAPYHYLVFTLAMFTYLFTLSS